MKGLVDYIVRGLVDEPDEVEIHVEREDDTNVYEVEVNESDIGRIIGRQGRTVNAIRTLVRAGAGKTGERTQVEILD